MTKDEYREEVKKASQDKDFLERNNKCIKDFKAIDDEVESLINKDNRCAYYGLFWLIKNINNENILYEIKECFIDGYTPLNHKKEWAKLKKDITKNHPFDYYPRGRVEIRKNKAIIFLNPILNKDEYIEKIINDFSLNEFFGIKEKEVKIDNSYHYQYKVEY